VASDSSLCVNFEEFDRRGKKEGEWVAELTKEVQLLQRPKKSKKAQQ